MARAPGRGGSAAVIFDDDGRVLLVKEGYRRKRWSLPGGAIERGETPEETAVRETLEETGLHVAIDHRIGSYSLDNGFTAHAFRCQIVSGRACIPATGEIVEIAWHPADALPTPRSNLLHYALPDALREERGIVRTDLPRVS